MSIEVPQLPDKFNWQQARLVFVQWFLKLRDSQLHVPTGTVAIYPVATPPSGWVLADGSTYDKVKYPALQKVLGTETSATQFQVPNYAAPPVGSKWIIKV